MNITRKTILSLCATACALLATTGCGNKETADASSQSIKVAYIAATPFIDGGWGSSCYAGIQNSAKKLNAKVYKIENLDLASFVSTTRQYAEMGIDLIISPDWNLSDAFLEVSKAYPDVHFAVIDGSFGTENFASISHNNKQVGFIAGVIAALQTQTKVIGFIGGEETPQILDGSAGMKAGARYIDDSIVVKSVMSGSWTDVALGKEIGLSLINSSNADVLFSFASGVDVGVREAVKSAKNCDFIAQPADLLEQAPAITLSSIVQSNENIIFNAMKAVIDGTFGGGFQLYGLEDGGTVSVGTFGASFDAEKQAKVLDIVAKVKNGSIDIDSYIN